MKTIIKHFPLALRLIFALFTVLTTTSVLPPQRVAAQSTPTIEDLITQSEALRAQIETLNKRMMASNQQMTTLTQQITAWQQANPNTTPPPAIQALIDQQNALKAASQQDMVALQNLLQIHARPWTIPEGPARC